MRSTGKNVSCKCVAAKLIKSNAQRRTQSGKINECEDHFCVLAQKHSASMLYKYAI